MTDFDPDRIDVEGRHNLFTKKPVIVATSQEVRPSRLTDDDIIGWHTFLNAWFQDRAEGSLNAPLIKALEVFILTWKLDGRGGYKVPITLRNPKNPEELVEITATTEKQPDFTYNPDGKKTIEEIQMRYRMWMDAVGDLKLNLSGSSHGDEATEHEHLHWGGPVDVSQDVPPIDLSDNAVDQVFDL